MVVGDAMIMAAILVSCKYKENGFEWVGLTNYYQTNIQQKKPINIFFYIIRLN